MIEVACDHVAKKSSSNNSLAYLVSAKGLPFRAVTRICAKSRFGSLRTLVDGPAHPTAINATNTISADRILIRDIGMLYYLIIDCANRLPRGKCSETCVRTESRVRINDVPITRQSVNSLIAVILPSKAKR
jgi:hypothetical protein